jgi:hypothetical protein
MDLTGIKPCIISCGVGGWYPAGIDRLKNSLIHHGWGGDTIFWKDEYPNGCPSHQDNPYSMKIFAFKEAFNRGYNVVCWLDCSFWAIRNPMPIFDIVNEYGNFGFRSGYNCAQTCPDNLLQNTGISRDEAEKIPETATGIVGINYANPKGKEVFDYWEEMCSMGLFKNSRSHNAAESSDPRYLHGRQDQSAYSMALYKAGVQFDYQDFVAYYNNGKPGYNPDKCYFFIESL